VITALAALRGNGCNYHHETQQYRWETVLGSRRQILGQVGQQEAKLSQRDRATLRVIEYFPESLKITQGHSK